MKKSTWIATPNIAVVKYWGKRNSSLNLPSSPSISVTMDESLCTKTTVEFSPIYRSDELVLNGSFAQKGELARAVRVLDAIRAAAGISDRARVESENNFPTAAGIASSASGFAALACAAAGAAGLKPSPQQLSIFARLGSGSACRSVLGGFVEWRMGKRQDGKDSYAVQIAPASHWPELRNVIAITDSGRKKTGSSDAMEITAKTSSLYKERLGARAKVVRMVKAAILKKDLASFLELAMRESSHMHAVMLDSYPPIIYLNDVSREIIYAVHEFNQKKGKTCAGYTFDAGPNAHVYTEEKYVPELQETLRGIAGVQKTIVCKAGNGPRQLSERYALF